MKSWWDIGPSVSLSSGFWHGGDLRPGRRFRLTFFSLAGGDSSVGEALPVAMLYAENWEV